MERPELVDYKEEIHHPNGFIEDRYMHNEYVEDLEKYVDYLESKLKNNGDLGDVVGQSEQLVCRHCKGLEVYIDEYGGKPCKCTKQAN